MTATDTDALIEKIAHALGKENYVYGPNAQALFRDEAAAVLPIVAEEVRKAKAEALREIAPHLNDSGDESFLMDAADRIETGGSDEHR